MPYSVSSTASNKNAVFGETLEPNTNLNVYYPLTLGYTTAFPQFVYRAPITNP